MSLSAYGWAWEVKVESTAQRVVLTALVEFAGNPELLAWPSYETLGQRTLLSRRKIAETIKQLRDAGFITDTGNRSGPTQRVVIYHVNYPGGNDAPPAPYQGNGAQDASVMVHQAQSNDAPRASRNPNKNPKENPNSKTSSATRQNTDGFVEFWAAYPRKRGKQNAEKIWNRKGMSKMKDMLIADVTKRKTDDYAWVKDGAIYIPHPSTYLNGALWEDEMEPIPTGGQGKAPDAISNSPSIQPYVHQEVVKAPIEERRKWHEKARKAAAGIVDD